jgi:hypothetical protein
MCRHRKRSSLRSQRWLQAGNLEACDFVACPVRKAPKLAEEHSKESSIL